MISLVTEIKMTSKYGSLVQKILGIFFGQNPISVFKTNGMGGKAFVAGPLKKDRFFFRLPLIIWRQTKQNLHISGKIWQKMPLEVST